MLTLAQLGTLLNAKVLGDPDYQISKCGAQLAFGVLDLADSLAEAKFSAGYGAAVLISPETETALHAENIKFPGLVSSLHQREFFSACRLFEAYRDLGSHIPPDAVIAPDAKVHPRAVLAQGVVVQSGVQIDEYALLFPGAIIEPGASIGAGTIVGAHAVIGAGVSIGSLCEIGPGSMIGVRPSLYTHANGAWALMPKRSGLTLGRRVIIGANSVIERGAVADTVIADDVLIGGQVYIAHDCILERGVLIVGQSGLASGTHIGEGASLMARVAVNTNIHIGAGAMVLATSGVSKDVPEGSVVCGSPARERPSARRVTHVKPDNSTNKLSF